MAHHKLNEDDDHFLQVPKDATLIFAGLGGTETWIERTQDCVVRIGVKSVGVATSDGGALEVCVDINGEIAKGQDGPSPLDAQLRASQAVQVLVKAGEKVAFKAYPNPSGVQVLRTVVWAADMVPEHAAKPAPNGRDHPAAQPSEAPAH